MSVDFKKQQLVEQDDVATRHPPLADGTASDYSLHVMISTLNSYASEVSRHSPSKYEYTHYDMGLYPRTQSGQDRLQGLLEDWQSTGTCLVEGDETSDRSGASSRKHRIRPHSITVTPSFTSRSEVALAEVLSFWRGDEKSLRFCHIITDSAWPLICERLDPQWEVAITTLNNFHTAMNAITKRLDIRHEQTSHPLSTRYSLASASCRDLFLLMDEYKLSSALLRWAWQKDKSNCPCMCRGNCVLDHHLDGQISSRPPWRAKRANPSTIRKVKKLRARASDFPEADQTLSWVDILQTQGETHKSRSKATRSDTGRADQPTSRDNRPDRVSLESRSKGRSPHAVDANQAMSWEDILRDSAC